jgi:hypothetical protein
MTSSPRKTLQVSLGLPAGNPDKGRLEWNIAPRAAFTWNATKKSTVRRRATAFFYDWYDSEISTSRPFASTAHTRST